MKRNLKKSIICLALVMSMLVGTSLTALASSGKVTYGGATAEWNMSTSKCTNTLSYKATAKLRLVGKLYTVNNISGITLPLDVDSGIYTSSSCPLEAVPGLFCSFVSDTEISKENYISAYIDGSCFITYSPKP